MDVYEDALINVLAPEGAPSSWRESEEFSPYIQRLASCGINKLSSECSLLQEERAAVLEQTKELAYTEYLTFIHAADCSKSMVKQLGSLDTQLSRTSDSVSRLHTTLSRFVSTSRSLLAARQLNTTTLAKHTQLLEILELSQLLDTCVRNNYHDEALEIIAYVRRLEKKHGHIPIVKSIVSEVQSSSQQMLSQLLSQLRLDTSLPNCLKVVGLIRTLDVFSECQLRIKFLHARDAWLTTALRAVPHHDAYQYLSKSVECARVHLFDIVTQYRAIFSDDDTRGGALHLHAILQSWLLHKVSGILSLLRKELCQSGGVSGSNLESLLAQCMFFGQSLSRIGADFRSLLPDIFQEAAGRQLERDVRAANHRFDESLSSFSLMDAFPLSAASQAASLPHQTVGSGSRPPLSLLEFPPLGHYLNSLVTAFNTLRLCCFTALLPRLLSLLTASLNKVVRSLVELHAVECSGFSAAETASFGRLCLVVCDALLPHINTACLRALYPLSHLATITGTSQLQLAKMNFGQLDAKTICSPLEPFLPARQPAAHAAADDDLVLDLTPPVSPADIGPASALSSAGTTAADHADSTADATTGDTSTDMNSAASDVTAVDATIDVDTSPAETSVTDNSAADATVAGIAVTADETATVVVGAVATAELDDARAAADASAVAAVVTPDLNSSLFPPSYRKSQLPSSSSQGSELPPSQQTPGLQASLPLGSIPTARSDNGLLPEVGKISTVFSTGSGFGTDGVGGFGTVGVGSLVTSSGMGGFSIDGVSAFGTSSGIGGFATDGVGAFGTEGFATSAAGVSSFGSVGSSSMPVAASADVQQLQDQLTEIKLDD